MTGAEHVLAGMDPARPSPRAGLRLPAGGEHHFEADRAAAEMLKSRTPELAEAARANRDFHIQAARWIAGQGVAQFIDIGSGLPAAGSTHEVVRRDVPGAGWPTSTTTRRWRPTATSYSARTRAPRGCWPTCATRTTCSAGPSCAT
jgi:hypothetical protein